jgi:hypothetical protein
MRIVQADLAQLMTSPFCGGLAGEIEEWEEFLAALQTRVEDAADCQELLDFFGRIFAEEDARNTMPTEHQLFQVGTCCICIQAYVYQD